MISKTNILLHIIGRYVKNTHKYSSLLQFIQKCNLLLGIGSGGFVESSGEREVLQKIFSKLPQELTVFDIGANQGQYASLLVENYKDKEFELHCFEPSTSAFAQLKKTLTKHNTSSIHLNNFAMGDRQEERLLWSDVPGSGLASFTKRRLDHFSIDFSHNEQVHVETIDAYYNKNKINHIDILKIDTEGHELNVLYGAREMFDSSAITFVQFEFGGCNIDTRTFVQDFFYFFQEYNFTIHLVTPSGFCMPMPQYKEAYEQFITTNFLAISNKVMPF